MQLIMIQLIGYLISMLWQSYKLEGVCKLQDGPETCYHVNKCHLEKTMLIIQSLDPGTKCIISVKVVADHWLS